MDSSYFTICKTTPGSSFYTVYCYEYSGYKILMIDGGHLECFQEKVDGQSFRVSGGEQIQLFIICMKKLQNEWHTEYLKKES